MAGGTLLPWGKAVATAVGWVLGGAGASVGLILLEEVLVCSNWAWIGVGVATVAAFASAPAAAWWSHRLSRVALLVGLFGVAVLLAVGCFWAWAYVKVGGGP
jgi:hypothetical protein